MIYYFETIQIKALIHGQSRIQLYHAFWQEIYGYGNLRHLQSSAELILKRHSVDHLYKEEKATRA